MNRDINHRFYDNDWFVCTLAAISLAAMFAANYFFHGGHLQW